MKKNVAWEDDSDDMKSSIEMWICRTHFEWKGNKVSVINCFGTYGGWAGANLKDENMGLLEIMVSNNEPEGWLTADKCMEYLESDKWS